MPTFARLEVWTESAAGGGSRVAAFDPNELAACTLKTSVAGTEGLTFTVARSHESLAELIAGRVVRVCWSDTTLDTEWRLAEDTQQSGRGDHGQVTWFAQAMALDLARAIFADFDSAGRPTFDYSAAQLTATQWLTNVVLPACTEAGLPYTVSVGTVDFTNTFDLKGEWSTALECVRAIQQPGKAPGDFRFRLNGTTDYKLDLLTSRGSTASTVRVQTARNLLENVRKRSLSTLGTIIVPRGQQGAATRDISQCLWRVQTVVDGTHADLEDPLGGADPILFDDQLNNYYVARVASTFSSQQITDCTTSNSRITVASTAGWSAGDFVRIFRTSGSAGERLISLKHPTRSLSPASSGYGPVMRILDMPQQVGDTNLVLTNPWMSTWTNSSNPADSWSRSTVTGVTYSRESTTIQNGTYSQKVVASGEPSYTVNVYSPTATPYTTSGLRFAAHAWVYVEAVGTALKRYVRIRVMKPDLSVSYADGDFVDPAEIVGAWTQLSVTNCDLSSASAGVTVLVEFLIDNGSNGDTSATYYVDSVGLGEADVPLSDVLYSGAIPMWQRANVLLNTISTPVAGYTLTLADLERMEPGTWDYEQLTLGGSIEVVDSDLADTTTQRLVEMEQDLLRPLHTTVQLQTPDVALTAALAGVTGGSLVAGTPSSPTSFGAPAPLRTTLAEYGITDGYTKTETLALLSSYQAMAGPPGSNTYADRVTDNTALGALALSSNTTGISNTAVGALAMRDTTTGGANVAVGSYALTNNEDGGTNTAVGASSLSAATSADYNTALGASALASATDAQDNVGVGYNALFSLTTGDSNTAVGVRALVSQVTGNGCVALGHKAGMYETGSDKLFIDNQDRGSSGASVTNSLIYGVFNATVANQTLAFNANVGVGGQAASSTTYLTTPAGTTGVSSFRIPHGSAPTSPVDGDIWTTTAGIYVRINGGTVGPLT